MKYHVIYHPGSYGTYLAWAIYTFSELNTTNEINLPFAPGGSAHNYRTQTGFQVVEPIHFLSNCNKNLIFIKPSNNNFLEYLDNYVIKQTQDSLDVFLDKIFVNYKEKIFKGWNSILPEKWQTREMLSYFLPSMRDHITGNYYSSQYHNVDGINIAANDIILSPESVLMQIYDFFNLKSIVAINKLAEIHKIYCNLQQNFNKDSIVENYVQCIIKNQNISFLNLTLFDEAWIQCRLRQQNLEIRCHGLNLFPSCSKDLLKLIYKSHNE